MERVREKGAKWEERQRSLSAGLDPRFGSAIREELPLLGKRWRKGIY